MKRWNVYLLTFEKGGVSRLVGSIESRREPVAKLKAMEKADAGLYQGKWSLYARLAEHDPISRP
jgi:hypothetical protein